MHARITLTLLLITSSAFSEESHSTLYEQRNSTLQGSVELRHHTHQFVNEQGNTQDRVQLQARHTMRFQKGRMRLYGTWGMIKDPRNARLTHRPFEAEINIVANPIRYLHSTSYGLFRQSDIDHPSWGAAYQAGLNTALKFPIFHLGGSWHVIATTDVSAFMWQRPDASQKIPGDIRTSMGMSWLPQIGKPVKLSGTFGQTTHFQRAPHSDYESMTHLHELTTAMSHYRLRSEINIAKDVHILYDFFHYFDGYFEKKRVDGRRFKHILRTVITF